MKAKFDEAFAEAYGDAVLIAARESGLEEDRFPVSSPFTLEQVLDQAFLPG